MLFPWTRIRCDVVQLLHRQRPYERSLNATQGCGEIPIEPYWHILNVRSQSRTVCKPTKFVQHLTSLFAGVATDRLIPAPGARRFLKEHLCASTAWWPCGL
jgi:hypothetical protein